MRMSSAIEWPRRLSLASLPTPLQPLDRISRELGGPRIWCKRDDLSGCLLSGNKVRKLEYTLAHAIDQGCNALITCGGIQSNHCRATAFAGAQLGMPVSLVLRENLPSQKTEQSNSGNFFLDKLAGAHYSLHQAHYYQSHLTTLLQQQRQRLVQQGLKPYIIPTGASDGVGIWGYLNACHELQNDFKDHDIAPDYIIVATGSGGTQAGLCVGTEYFQLGAEVLGFAVCDSTTYFQDKIYTDIEQWRQQFAINRLSMKKGSFNINDQYVGEGYSIASPAIFDTIAWLAREEGVVLDPVYTGKAFYGLVEEIKKGRFAHVHDIVFLHTGGLFGVFAQQAQFEQQF